ncbi:MAG: class I SAM-dependent methyltransferase [Brevinematia bacterium]
MPPNKFDKVALLYYSFMHFWRLYKDKVILGILNLKGNETIVDLGGGTGHYSCLLSKFSKKVVVIDESSKMLGRMPNLKNVEKICGNILNVPFEDDTFDVALICDVYHHIEDQKGLLREAFRILKKNGKLVIYDFEVKNPITKILEIFERFLFGRLYFMSRDEIESILQKSGFIIKEMICT